MYAIYYPKTGSWIADMLGLEGDYNPFVIGPKDERKLYPTREAAQTDLDETCSLGTYEIKEVQ